MFTLLIVEDDRKILDTIEKTIHTINKGIKILKSREGKKALKIAKATKIDVFIIDINLPELNGIELAEEIRKTYPFHPIIIESSEGDLQYQVQVHDKIENLAYLKKPYSSEKIIAKVNHAIGIAKTLGTNQLKIKQQGFYRLIDINNILYIEKVIGKNSILMTTYNQHMKYIEKEEFKGISLISLLNMLTDKKDLIRCHKGYIVNPKMIEKLNYANNTINLKNTDEEIPISKSYMKNIDLHL